MSSKVRFKFVYPLQGYKKVQINIGGRKAMSA